MDDRQDVAVYEGTPGWMAPAIVVLTLIAIAGLGFGWYDYSRINDSQQTDVRPDDTDEDHAGRCRSADRGSGSEADPGGCLQCRTCRAIWVS